MTIPGGGYGNFAYNTDGSIELTSAVPATANRGLLSIGAGPWDGASAGHFSGSETGTVIAANIVGGFGNLIDLQVGGVSVLKVDGNGQITLPSNGLLVAQNQLSTIAGSVTRDPLRSFEVRGMAGQTAPIQKWEDVSGSALASVRNDGLMDNSVSGVATKQKAGAPVDGDWTVAPPNGTLVVDSTDNKLYVRVGGAWKGVVFA